MGVNIASAKGQVGGPSADLVYRYLIDVEKLRMHFLPQAFCDRVLL
jgi:hypothetical protein